MAKPYDDTEDKKRKLEETRKAGRKALGEGMAGAAADALLKGRKKRDEDIDKAGG